MFDLWEAIAEIKENEALAIVRSRLNDGADPLALLEECRQGLTVVGERFDKKDYFLPELFMSSEIFKGVMEIIRPRLAETGTRDGSGRVVIGTARGDMHDLGKNIVCTLLECHGFQVRDLGVDVEPLRFVEAIRETRSRIVGFSCMMTTSIESMKETVKALEDADLRHKVKIIVGGAVVNEGVGDYIGADIYGKDPVEGLALVRRFTEGA